MWKSEIMLTSICSLKNFKTFSGVFILFYFFNVENFLRRLLRCQHECSCEKVATMTHHVIKIPVLKLYASYDLILMSTLFNKWITMRKNRNVSYLTTTTVLELLLAKNRRKLVSHEWFVRKWRDRSSLSISLFFFFFFFFEAVRCRQMAAR